MASLPGKPGFVLSLEAAFGFGLLSQWEKPNVAEGELVMGFRLKAFPLTLLVGYGARADYVPTGQVVEVYNEFYNKIIRTIEGQHNVVHGPVLRISVGF